MKKNMTPLGTNSQVIINNTGPMNIQRVAQNGTTKIVQTVEPMEIDGPMYKLVIQIDKITAKPGPRSRKLALLAAIKKKQIAEINEHIKLKRKATSEPTNIDSDPKSMVTVPENFLDETKSKNPSFIDKIVQCHDCGNSFPIKMRLGCQICGVPCGNKFLCDNHEKLHENSDSKLQLKCDPCRLAFLKKPLQGKVKMMVYPVKPKPEEVVKVQTPRKPINLEFQCKICKLVLDNQKALKEHSLLHPTRTEDKTTNLLHGEGSKKNDRKSIPIVRENIEIGEENSIKKCNICSKFFITEEMLNQHLSLHLSQAHHCGVCRKVFINRTTLHVHMKSHEN